MKIYLVTVGKIKNKSYIAEIENYLKQIPYQVQIIEIKDEPTKEGMKKEKEAILKKIPKNSYIICLDRKGKEYSSIKFSSFLENLINTKNKDIVFIIGGSYGIDYDLLVYANEKISFSKLTFPHQLMRVILVEQIYRAFKIMENHPYHKWGRHDKKYILGF